MFGKKKRSETDLLTFEENHSPPPEADLSFCILNLFCKSENDKMGTNKKRNRRAQIHLCKIKPWSVEGTQKQGIEKKSRVL